MDVYLREAPHTLMGRLVAELENTFSKSAVWRSAVRLESFLKEPGGEVMALLRPPIFTGGAGLGFAGRGGRGRGDGDSVVRDDGSLEVDGAPSAIALKKMQVLSMHAAARWWGLSRLL